ncbi:hypothetical protein TRFO_11565 [Tritrichomonas foetus]|uniref:Uncharacterized protein n=1 Tax=Tritrichomonas foetus TaxID=1144522 RepID=A0A1J4J4Z5_9EUKA|nr:hypothetical protein TRFO_11565 [Tritrichomonas foetus]|eukprot:OHS93769.1 hypothetical protein TRFO_11565 [Tritrichomonas foetus]
MGKALISLNSLSQAALKSTPPSEALQLVQSFRQELSLNWLNDYIRSNLPLDHLVKAWTNLIGLVDHSDVNVRVATFSAIGALIAMIGPVFPRVLTDSFKTAFPSFDFSPNKSVAVISSYLYLVNYLPFLLRTEFIESINIMPHFSSDISQFIQHIPHLVPLMKPFDSDFQKAFLRSLLVSFARSPNVSFNEAVLKMVKLNLPVLIDDTIDFLYSNGFIQSVLSIASTFLLDKEVSSSLSDKHKQLFEDEALKILKNPESQFSDVEKSCLIISSLLKEKKIEGLHELPFDSFPKHLHKFLIQIDPNLEKLKIDFENDSQIMKQSKLRALIHIDFEKDDSDFVLSIFEQFSRANEKGDTFTAFVDCFRLCFHKIKCKYIYSQKQTVADIIGRIILTKTDTWVEQNAIIELIGEINDEGALFMNDFEDTSINILLNCAISPYNKLSANAIQNLCKLATQDTLEIIIQFIYSCDLFDVKICQKILLILNSLINEFGHERFVQFNSLVKEMILFNFNLKIVGNGFALLRKIYFHADQDLANYGINWICALYRSYTQCELNLPNLVKKDDNNISVPNMLSIVETDIVSSDLLSKNTVTKSLFSIFKFLVQQEFGNAISVFPEMIQLNPNVIKLCHISYEQILKVLTECRTYKTAALACDEMKHDDKALIPFLVKIIDRILVDPDVSVPILASLFRMMSNNEVYEAKIKTKLNEAQYKLFQMKLKRGKFNLTQEQFNSLLISQLNINFIEAPIIIEDINNLDFNHLRFVFEHRELFEIKNPEIVKEISKMSFQKTITRGEYKIMASAHSENTENKNGNDCDVQETIPSLIPGLFFGKFPFCPALINSFFLHSELKISQELFHQSFERLLERLPDSVKYIKNAINYSIKFNLSIPDDTIIKLLNYQELLPVLITKVTIESKPVNNGNNQTSNVKQHIFKEILKILNADENTPLLLNVNSSDPNNVTLYDFAVILDTERQFSLIFRYHFELKKIWLKRLCFWIQRFSYSGDELKQFIQSIFEEISEIQSNLKILFILRLVHSFVFSLTKNSSTTKNFAQNPAVPFLESLFDFFEPIRNSDIDSLHIEISAIFNYVFLFIRPTQKIVSFFNDFDLKLKQNSVYLGPMTTSFVSASLSSFRMSKMGMHALLNSTFYSTKFIAMKALQILLHPSASMPSFCLFEMSMPLFFKIANNYKESKEFASVIAAIFQTALKHPNFHSIKSTFTPQAINVAFSIPPSSASFVYYEPVMSDLLKISKPSSQTNQVIQTFMGNVQKCDNCLYNIAQTYSDCIDWIISNEKLGNSAKNDRKITELKSKKVKHLQRFFQIAPNSTNRRLYLNSIFQQFEGFDRTYFVFAKVPMLGSNFLQSYVLLYEFLRSCTKEEKERCVSLVNNSADAFPSEKVVEALKNLINGKIMEGAVIASGC